MWSFHKVVLIGLVAISANLPSPSLGDGFPGARGTLQTADGIMLAIQSRGRNVPLWEYRGRYGVAGTPGEEFSVYLYNPGPGTKKFVVTLDGVNVIDGSRGSSRGLGYILQPGQSEVIRGWRDGNYHRRFVFDWKGRDVATMLGQAGNQGTLGLAVWDGYVHRGNEIAAAPGGRQAPAPTQQPMRQSDAPASRSSRGGAQASPNDLGVGQGQSEFNPIRRVEFRATDLVAQMSLFYATLPALQHVGAQRVDGAPPAVIPRPSQPPYQQPPRPPFQPPYQRPEPPRVRPPWGGNPFPQDAPSVFRNRP